ncbi:UDP-galactopyranose mutase [Picosynechococcus sp. PCC 7003]|uniref:FAD-dependent oxidoreductase n=1 Tax=Picosynechococcus sp. PCC 7003 TaxID=374981 RepID=UPI00081037FD|nr:FAD-dependent oxidoreductase [Picosynechococcus sp. PCC 7003]ANV84046.1 UDP-galactopyranose mutase [Picosynechococcus sp. PCC 7003]
MSDDNTSLPPISRRSALKLLGVGAAGSMVGYTRFAKPHPTIHQQESLDLPRYHSQGKKVVVIGGGLAGLAAAYELSQRGFQVTLLEKAPQLGGKVASWKINVGDDEFMMEHGFHGFFPQYYNLKSLVSELSINDNFQSLDFYSLVFKDPDRYRPEVFRPSNTAFPWNIVDLAISSPNRLRWGINLTKIKHLEVFHAITGFKIPRTYDTYDTITVADWVRGEFPQGLYDLYFLPFAKSSLNAPDTLSTGELLQFFHFYFFGNPEGLAFNGTVDDMGTSLVQPIAAAIRANGGQILTDVSVSEIQCQDNKIQAIAYQQGDEQTDVPFWTKKNELIAADSLEYYGAGDAMYAVNPETEEGLSLTCTHQGCTVGRQPDGSFLCPCHGARYDANGKRLSGPAQRDLPQFKVQDREADQVQLVAENPSNDLQRGTLAADYVVLATDVPGTRHLFTRLVGDRDPEAQRKVDQLVVSDPFAVGRFWLDRDFPWEHSKFASLSGYALTDSITLYHQIQTQFKDWAARTGGSVVELHAYCYKEKEFPTQEALLATFEQELYEIVPELKGATVIHRQLVNQKNFSGYPPNSYGDRPTTESEISNLMYAGDWVKMPFPCGLMERAISSGLLAANSILQREGVQRRPILSVNPEGVFKI